MQPMSSQPRALSATSLIGDSVTNAQGENLGKIEDLMIDLAEGSVSYAVLSFGGLLVIGNKLFAVPLEAMSVVPDAHELMLDIDQERLENAPGFDKNNWPDGSDRDWTAAVYRYYGCKPYRER